MLDCFKRPCLHHCINPFEISLFRFSFGPLLQFFKEIKENSIYAEGKGNYEKNKKTWKIEYSESKTKLTEFDINYRPRPSIKAQILADFMLECTIPVKAGLGSSDTNIGAGPSHDEAELWQPSLPEERVDLPEGFWVLHVDGSSNSVGAGAGLVLVSPEGVIVEYALHLEFPTTNNGAEYEALIVGLKIARELKVDRL